MFCFKQFSLAWVHSLIAKNISISTIHFSQTVLIQPVQFSISIDFVYTQLNIKTVLFQKIQFNVSTITMLKTAQFQIIQFSISTQFKFVCTVSLSKYFYFKLFSLVKQF